ncbi:hypothetical protein ABT096_32480 [Streptomyces sp. NPDC002561]|uniref:hypothetical protein n=1 Tax=Streptomyces sp. NPDC002561 TaxID=3154418 RepID=UPI00331DB10C
MDSETTIALIGAGSALLGALIGGGAAVIGANKAARSAYLGPLRVARRAEQAAAHKSLLTAANDYDIAVSQILRTVLELNQHAIAQAEGRQGILNDLDVVAYRAGIERVGTADQVVAAVRHVALQGPKEVYEAAEGVRRMAHILEYSLAHVETIHHAAASDSGTLPAITPVVLSDAAEGLSQAIHAFAEVASEHLNGSK